MPFAEDLDLGAVRNREDLAELLRILHARADRPSLRALGKWSVVNGRPALAKTTVSEMLAGKRLPRKGALLAFVEACGIPAERLGPWQRAWERVAPAEAARPTPQAELRRLRQEAEAAAEIRAAEIIAGAQVRAAQLLSETADQGPDQDLRQRMVQVWVAEDRVKQALADAERKAQSIVATAIEQATAIRLGSAERLERERAELGRIKVEIIEQTVRLRAVNSAIGEGDRDRSAVAELEPRQWQANPEVQSVREAYDALLSLFRMDVERQIRLRDKPS
jgi:hypothetical protein